MQTEFICLYICKLEICLFFIATSWSVITTHLKWRMILINIDIGKHSIYTCIHSNMQIWYIHLYIYDRQFFEYVAIPSISSTTHLIRQSKFRYIYMYNKIEI